MLRAFSYACLVIASISLASCLDTDDDGLFDSAEQFQNDLNTIDQYLVQQGISARIDSSSLIRYVINERGDGLQPVVADSLTISYQARVLSTGDIVETVQEETRPLNQWLEGVLTSISLIREGGSITAYVPSAYGFGNVQIGEVPPNSPLILDIQFHEFHAGRLIDDLAVINDSLAQWQIDAETHPSGIRYTINQGSGFSPQFDSDVTVTYDARLFGQTESVDAGNNVSFNLTNLILAWRLMLPVLREGGSMTIYVPSSFAYGSQGQGAIPPNANLEFDIELISVN